MYQRPLVSILIPNYNYGRYLENCFESILSQTYTEYEVIFRDNNSTDNSYEIALKYQEIFKKKGIFCSVTKGKRNVGSNRNSTLCLREAKGDLYYYLASDDAINPDFLQRCVDIFVEYPNVGLVMTHREEMDDEGQIYKLPPFYNRDCIVPAESQAAVFMMAGIAIPGQRMYRAGILLDYREMQKNFQVAGDWAFNFMLSCEADVAYIAAPLCRYRVHRGNETNESEKRLVGVFEHYQLINFFNEIGKVLGMKKVEARYEKAVEKLGHMCLRYSMKMIQTDYYSVAKQYINLAPVFNISILEETEYQRILNYLNSSEYEMEKNKDILINDLIFDRKYSYEPPEDAIYI